MTVLNPWDIGVENCLLQHPVRVEPYVAYLPPNANNVRHSVQNLTWRFEDAIGDLSQITAYLLAEYIVRIVDEATGGSITSKADADTVFALVQDYVYDEQRPAMKAGKYPVFDPPDKSINANTNLLNKTVQPRALLEAHNESDTVPTKAVNEEEHSDDNEVIVTVDEVPSLFMI